MVLIGTNPIVLTKVHDLRMAGRLIEPVAPALEGVRSVLKEEKTEYEVFVLGRIDASAHPVGDLDEPMAKGRSRPRRGPA
jgi:hypothetical protein